MFKTYIELQDIDSSGIVDIYVQENTFVIWTVGFIREYPNKALDSVLDVILDSGFKVINGYSKLNN